MRHIRRYCRQAIQVTFACLFIGSVCMQVAVAQTEKASEPNNKASSVAATAAYGDAANMQNDGEFELAAEEWKKFLEKYPADSLAPQARHYLGVCLMQQNRFTEAIEAFQQVVTKHPDFEFVTESHLNLGWCQYSAALNGNANQFSAAAKTLAEFLEKRAESELTDQALFYLGECLYLDGKKDAAIPVYRRLMKDHADSQLRPDAMYALGVAQQETGNFADARETFDRFLDDFGQHQLVGEIRMRKGETLIQQNQFAEAEKLFAVVAADKDFTGLDQALFRQAFCVLSQKRYDEAARLYARIPSERPDSQFALAASIAAGQAFFQANNLDEAAAWLRKVADQDNPASFEATHWLCRIAMRQQNPGRAKDLAAAAIKKAGESPFLPTLRLDHADAMYELPDGKAKALPLYLNIVKEFDDHAVAPQALYNAAYAAMELARYDEAMDHASDFMLRFAKHRLAPDALYVSAESHLLSGQHAEAEWLYTTLIDSHQNHPQLTLWRLRRAAALQIQEKYQEALDALQPRIPNIEDPDLLAEAHYLIGVSQSRLGDAKGAAQSLETSLQASATWRRADDAVLLLSQSLLAVGKKGEASQVFDRFNRQVDESDRPDAVRYQMAEAKYQADQFAEALEDYSLLIERWPKSEFIPNARFGQAWSQFKTGDAAAATETLTLLIENHPQHELIPRAYRTRAMCRQMTEDYQGGIADIERFLQTNPAGDDVADALFMRGLCESALGQVDDARETFAAILKNHADYRRADRVLYELAWALKSTGQAQAASEHFARIAQQFPASDLAAEANYHVAENHYQQKKYAEAIEHYKTAAAKSNRGDIGEKAAYKLGWSHFQQAAYQPALASFRTQVSKFPQGKLVADGRFMIGECLFKSGQYEQALQAYEEVPTNDLAENSRALSQLHAGQAAAQLKRWEDTIRLLAPLISENPNSPFVSHASYELARAHQNLNQNNRAEELYRFVVETSRSNVGAQARFMLGELYFARKEFGPALREFQRLMYGYGGKDAPADIKPWQAKAGLEAGRVLAIQAGQEKAASRRRQLIERAKKYLRYVVEQHRGTDEATAAARQLKRIGA